MSRPLIVSDCDEVLLHMVVPFREWLDEHHGIHFDFSSLFEEALRHKDSGDVVERIHVWRLLGEFFDTEMHRQGPIAGAVDTMTIGVAREVVKEGIRINAVSPGAIDTEIHEPGRIERIMPNLPMGRVGTPEEVAEAILFLLSDAASFVTGERVTVNGGHTTGTA